MVFKWKGKGTAHSEIKSVQYGIFITLEDDSWEFRTIEEINKMKTEMDEQVKELLVKSTEKLKHG